MALVCASRGSLPAATVAPLMFLLLLLLLAFASPARAKDAREAIIDSALTDEFSLLQHSSRVLSPTVAADLPAGPKPCSHRSRAVPTIVVDLDVAPELRWQNVTRYYTGLGAMPDCCTGEGFEILLPFAPFISVEDEYRREFEGIVADVGHPSVTLDSLKLLSAGYEFSGLRLGSPRVLLKTAAQLVAQGGDPAVSGLGGLLAALAKAASMLASGSAALGRRSATGCSGILAATRNGTVIHGRNMDYAGLEIEVGRGRVLRWPEVTIDTLFTKGGKPFIVSAGWPGVTGLHTAMRFGGWSFEQNTRFHGVGQDVLYGALHHSEGFCLRARRIMETTPDFETAVQKLYDSNLMAPQYFIVAGTKPYQGAVITIDRGGAHDGGKPTPGVVRLDRASKTWYLVQTNDDQLDTPIDSRRPDEQLRLSAASQDMVSTQWMWDEVLSPALYNENTVFSSVLVPATGYYETRAHPGQIR